jgi:hypothetical protein
MAINKLFRIANYFCLGYTYRLLVIFLKLKFKSHSKAGIIGIASPGSLIIVLKISLAGLSCLTPLGALLLILK